MIGQTMKLPADPAARLALFEEVAFQLASGSTRGEVRQGENFIRFHLGSVPYLEREISRLRAIVGKRTAITIEQTPQRNVGFPQINKRNYWENP